MKARNCSTLRNGFFFFFFHVTGIGAPEKPPISGAKFSMLVIPRISGFGSFKCGQMPIRNRKSGHRLEFSGILKGMGSDTPVETGVRGMLRGADADEKGTLV